MDAMSSALRDAERALVNKEYESRFDENKLRDEFRRKFRKQQEVRTVIDGVEHTNCLVEAALPTLFTITCIRVKRHRFGLYQFHAYV